MIWNYNNKICFSIENLPKIQNAYNEQTCILIPNYKDVRIIPMLNSLRKVEYSFIVKVDLKSKGQFYQVQIYVKRYPQMPNMLFNP